METSAISSITSCSFNTKSHANIHSSFSQSFTNPISHISFQLSSYFTKPKTIKRSRATLVLRKSSSSDETTNVVTEDEWVKNLPDKKKPLYSHSLPCVEGWLKDLGFVQSNDDRAVWVIEKTDWHAKLSLDVTDLYISMSSSLSTYLVFDLHFGGTFEFCPLRYVNGVVGGFTVKRDNKLDFQGVCNHLRKRIDEPLHELFFRLPECELDKGLKIVQNDKDLTVMYAFAESYGLIHLYISHGPQELEPFYIENITLCHSDDEVESRKIPVKDAGNMSVGELITWAEEEAAMIKVPGDGLGNGPSDSFSPCQGSRSLDKGSGTQTKDHGSVGQCKVNVDKGKAIMVHEGKKGQSRKEPRKRNVGIVIDENLNPSLNDYSDSDSEIDLQQMFEVPQDYDSDSEYSDKSVDYLSEGEDELISLRKRKTEAKLNPTPTKPYSNTEDHPCPRQTRVYDVAQSDIVRDHQEYMDNLMYHLRQGDDGLFKGLVLQGPGSSQAGNMRARVNMPIRQRIVIPRAPSQRILQKKLSKIVKGPGSSHGNSLQVD